MIKKILLSSIIIGMCLFPIITNAGEKEEAECNVTILEQQKIILELKSQLLQVAHDQTNIALKAAAQKVDVLTTKEKEEKEEKEVK